MKKVQDHYGKTYKSVKDMCRMYGVEYYAYRYRITHGYTLEEALAPEGKGCIDYKGIKYKSETEMCNAYGISQPLYRYRIAHGCPMRQALNVKPNRRVV